MNNGPDQRLVMFVPTLFVAMIVIIAVIGEKGDGWYDFVFEFQTLITGVLAILAAYITINQMRRSDARADKRHEDLMQTSLADIQRRNARTKASILAALTTLNTKREIFEKGLEEFNSTKLFPTMDSYDQLTDPEWIQAFTIIERVIKDHELRTAASYIPIKYAIVINAMINMAEEVKPQPKDDYTLEVQGVHLSKFAIVSSFSSALTFLKVFEERTDLIM